MTTIPKQDRAHRLRDEAGMTLIEMLIAVVLTGVIMTVLFASFQVFYTNSTYTSSRDDHSGGAEIVATWLDRDLASGTGKTALGSGPCKATSTTKLTITWSDYAPKAGDPEDNPPVAGASYAVIYNVLPQTPAGKFMLQRIYCAPSGSSSLILANDLATADF